MVPDTKREAQRRRRRRRRRTIPAPHTPCLTAARAIISPLPTHKKGGQTPTTWRCLPYSLPARSQHKTAAMTGRAATQDEWGKRMCWWRQACVRWRLWSFHAALKVWCCHSVSLLMAPLLLSLYTGAPPHSRSTLMQREKLARNFQANEMFDLSAKSTLLICCQEKSTSS